MIRYFQRRSVPFNYAWPTYNPNIFMMGLLSIRAARRRCCLARFNRACTKIELTIIAAIARLPQSHSKMIYYPVIISR